MFNLKRGTNLNLTFVFSSIIARLAAKLHERLFNEKGHA